MSKAMFEDGIGPGPTSRSSMVARYMPCRSKRLPSIIGNAVGNEYMSEKSSLGWNDRSSTAFDEASSNRREKRHSRSIVVRNSRIRTNILSMLYIVILSLQVILQSGILNFFCRIYRLRTISLIKRCNSLNLISSLPNVEFIPWASPKRVTLYS